jgi:hypothetical protein
LAIESSEVEAKESTEVNTSNSQNFFDAITSNIGIVAGVAVAAVVVVAGSSSSSNDDNTSAICSGEGIVLKGNT